MWFVGERGIGPLLYRYSDLSCVTENSAKFATGIAAGIVTLLTLAVAFGGLAVGWSTFWIAFPIGFGGVLPVATVLTAWYYSEGPGSEDGAAADADTTAGAEAALHALREQYATGEIDELEFERRLERLLETESIEDAENVYANVEADDRYTTDRSDRDRERTDREYTDRERA